MENLVGEASHQYDDKQSWRRKRWRGMATRAGISMILPRQTLGGGHRGIEVSPRYAGLLSILEQGQSKDPSAASADRRGHTDTLADVESASGCRRSIRDLIGGCAEWRWQRAVTP